MSIIYGSCDNLQDQMKLDFIKENFDKIPLDYLEKFNVPKKDKECDCEECSLDDFDDSDVIDCVKEMGLIVIEIPLLVDKMKFEKFVEKLDITIK